MNGTRSRDTPEFQFARWIAADDPKTLDRFLARNAFNLEYTGDHHNKGISFSDVKDIHKRKPAA